MRFLSGTLLFLGVIASNMVHAASAVDRLHHYLDSARGLSADFEQVVMDQERAEVQRSAGKVRLQRPSRFRWDYTEPYEQLILSNGKRFWIYDAELAQVTVKPLDKAIARTPAMVLSSDKPVEEDYDLLDLGTMEGLDWVELVPKVKDTDYDRVRLGFLREDLKSMELTDGFGQITRITFSNVTLNPHMNASLFTFDPPAGVDVIEAQ
ncbi:MAG: outer membrane lipoprotein chaperone LolA [Gammaproteobacteria bacterium]